MVKMVSARGTGWTVRRLLLLVGLAGSYTEVLSR